MFAANRETPALGDIGQLPPRLETPRCELSRDIDLDRVVWDQEYREEVRLYLNSGVK
jgi:hypothetical protein